MSCKIQLIIIQYQYTTSQDQYEFLVEFLGQLLDLNPWNFRFKDNKKLKKENKGSSRAIFVYQDESEKQ